MTIAVSTTVFPEPLVDPARLPDLEGIEAVEFSGGPPMDLEGFSALARAVHVAGVRHVLVHNYYPPPPAPFVLNFATADPAILERCLDLARDALAACALAGAPHWSFHPGYRRDGRELPDGHFAFDGEQASMEKTLSRFLANFPRLQALADVAGIPLVVENLFPKPGEVTSLCNTRRELLETFDALPAGTGFLLDLGHWNVSARVLGFDRDRELDRLLDTLAPRLREVHLSANTGLADDHLPLERGDWQLDVLPRLRGTRAVFTLESRRLPPAVLRRTLEVIKDAL
ncbi:hypothetical protein NNJEOMEG_02685 [Fundidesulfovibrio magnetotacticus]|uniref:Xylose isomerase-like TIM barrel domain-containing protein n=1 Tax=Fundidesulfovibrio magnetotacticus TaxID=2730080 RepID=A0A6V8LYW7_9BACT|nr:TIM barrel protein [Fundidesulfovibrio magnetotacticus]GFK94837.1 hypothetical protein NNJEOMEG_02685 [Fundidesulfovibrio magnetotacticus]